MQKTSIVLLTLLFACGIAAGAREHFPSSCVWHPTGANRPYHAYAPALAHPWASAGARQSHHAPAPALAHPWASQENAFTVKASAGDDEEMEKGQSFNKSTKVMDVIKDSDFQGFGHLIFPVDRHISSDLTLADMGDVLVWYSYVNPMRTVEIVNYLKTEAETGRQIFFDIYTEEEKKADPWKRNTGLFFFRGQPGSKFAVLSAGGGFAYVGAMHDSFPHALELSKRGYHAFALIYRPDAEKACEDLARAIAFIHEHSRELEVDVRGYSLWGGSAGARMAAWLGSFGTERFGEKAYPRGAAVIMEYTGLSEVYGNEPPTYNCVGTSDSIASWHTMERRIQRIRENGTDAEIDVFPGLPHGFGLGEGTAAEGWIDHAVAFWERQM